MDELTDYEKMINGISQFAGLIRAYHDALIESGFTANQAFLLTAQYQRDVLSLMSAKTNGNNES